MQEIPITTEQEAAVAILFASVMNGRQNLASSEVDQLSRMLVLSSKFKETSLNDHTVKALSLHAKHGSKLIIEHSAPLITEEFRETLFCMCCEMITFNGKVDEKESEVLALVALHLGLSMENMRMYLTTYLIRNRWNVEVVESDFSGN